MCTFFVGAAMQCRWLRKILFSLFPAGQNKVIRMIFHLIWFVFVLSSFWGFKKIENNEYHGTNKWRFMYWPYIRKSLSVHWYFNPCFFVNRNLLSLERKTPKAVYRPGIKWWVRLKWTEQLENRAFFIFPNRFCWAILFTVTPKCFILYLISKYGIMIFHHNRLW